MGWWFGRKSAPADARPFVPAWLTTADEEVGFARSFEGLTAFVRTTGTCATFRSGAWEVGALRGAKLLVDGLQVVGARAAAIADPSGGASVDAEARAAIGQVLAVLRGHGLIAT